MTLKRKKRRLLLVLLPIVVLLLAGLYQGSYALFSSKHTLVNQMKTNYGASLEEDFQPPGSGWHTSTDVTKKVWVVNTGKTDVLVRVHYAEFWQNKDGKPLSSTLTSSGQTSDVVQKTWTASWQNDWVLHDGWYYYLHVLKAGEQTPVFLSKLNLNTTLIHAVQGTDAAYYNAGTTYHLNFYDETVQADPGAAVTQLWNAAASINSSTGVVSWDFTP